VVHAVKVHTVKQAPPDEPQALRQRIRARSLAVDTEEVTLPPVMDIQKGRHASWAGKADGQIPKVTNPEGRRSSQETERVYRRGRGSLDQPDHTSQSQARYAASEQEGVDNRTSPSQVGRYVVSAVASEQEGVMERPRRRRSTASRMGPKVAIMPTEAEEGHSLNSNGRERGQGGNASGREGQSVSPSPDRASRGRRSLQIAPAGEGEGLEDYLL
jgi:hypothetical protein